MTRIWLPAALAALALGVGAALAARDPRPLGGVPLGESGLRLVVADDPPFVLDVDAGTTRPLGGARPRPGAIHWILSLDGRAAAIVSDEGREDAVYGVGGSGRGTRLGTGAHVWAAAGGVWIQRRSGRACTLRLVRVDGRQVRAPRAFPCGTRSDRSAGSLGLVVGRTRVVDPVTGRLVRRTRWGVLAGARGTLVLAGPGRRFTVSNGASGRERRLAWPSVLAHRDEVAVDPGGRWIALGFADPAWQMSGQQVSDVWVLDTRSGSLTQVPGLPAFVSLKRTSMVWTADGRLVILGESRHERRAFVAVWRPGRKTLAVKTIGLPQRNGASDTFAPLAG